MLRFEMDRFEIWDNWILNEKITNILNAVWYLSFDSLDNVAGALTSAT